MARSTFLFCFFMSEAREQISRCSEIEDVQMELAGANPSPLTR